MAIADTARLLASLELQDKFTPAIKNANRALGRFDAKLADTGSRGYRAGQQIGTGIQNVGKLAVAGFGILAANVALGVDSLIKVENAQAQTNAVIKSTGGIAGVSAEQVRKLAERYEGLNATMGDETIQAGENLLLTFTNIKDKAFEPTLKAALDMNQALGKGPEGLTGTVRILGKALNDPTKGLSALGRVGITFSKDQQKRIKQLQKEGKLYEAQALILGELEKRFGGSFAAAGDTTAGKVAKFTDSIEDLQRALAGALLPTIGNVADALTEFLSDPQTVRDFEELGKSIAKLFSPENIRTGIQALKDGFTFLKGIAGPIADVIGTAVKAFTSLPPDIQKLLVGGFAVNKLTGGLVTNIAGGIFGALKAMTVQAAVVNVSGAVVNGGGVPGVGGAAGGAGGGIGGAVAGASAATIGLSAVALAGISLAVKEGANAAFKTPTNQAPGFQAPQMFNPIPAIQNVAAVLGVIRDRLAHPPVPPIDPAIARVLATFRDDRGNQGKSGKGQDDIALAQRLTNERVQTVADRVGKLRDDAVSATDRTTGAANDTTKSVNTAKLAIDGAKRATEYGASQVAAAVRNKDLSVELQNKTVVTVNVSATGVKSTTTYQNRVGKSTGSHGGGSTGHAPGTGPLP